MNQVWLAFLAGLTTGGISCLAVQGGLLASATTSAKENRYTTVSIFLIFKLIAYTLLGAFLGFVGSSLIITPTLQGVFQILVGLFMLATAGRLLNLHPIFRYTVIQPPSFIYKFMKNQSKAQSILTPAVLGFLTVLIPCGVTQAMMIIAVATGSAFWGAMIMAAFTLGTSPVFFVLGASAAALMKRRLFNFLAAGAIAILGIIAINTGQVLRGSPHILQNYYTAFVSIFKESRSAAVIAAEVKNGIQEATITVKSNGYESSINTLRVGVPVKLTLITDKTQGCSRAFNIPAFNISKILPESGREVIEFTPTKTGQMLYTCSMGMFRGNFDII